MEKNHWEIILSLQDKQNMSLGAEVEKMAREQPEKTAIVYQERKISYEQLNAEANRYANLFQQQGFKKGDVVVLLMGNQPEYLMVVTGLSKLGVIVSLVDSRIRGGMLAHDINLCEARAIIVSQELWEDYLEIAAQIRLKTPGLIFKENEAEDNRSDYIRALAPLLQAASDQNPTTTNTISSEDLLVYAYTSGHSGLRKAVAINQQRWLIQGHLFSFLGHMNEATVQYMCLPLHYSANITGAFAGMIISGSTMVLEKKFSVHRFWDDIRSYGANYLIAVGEMGRYLCEQAAKRDDQDNPLEVMVCTGFRRDLLETFSKRFNLKHAIEVYIQTEGVGTFANFEEVPGMCGNLSLMGLRQGELVKYDFSKNEMKRDENSRARKCLPGEPGLLICEINELNRFGGYINDQEATENALLQNVFREGDLYFNSGDLLQLHENDNISFVDRMGETYRWKGQTVSAHQVADVIKKFYGGIEDAVVYGVKVPGMEGRCGMATLKLLEDEPLDWGELTKFIHRRIPDHARPIFIRISSGMDADLRTEKQKRRLQNEAFDVDVVRDAIYFLDPHQDQYVPMNRKIYAQIQAQLIPF